MKNQFSPTCAVPLNSGEVFWGFEYENKSTKIMPVKIKINISFAFIFYMLLNFGNKINDFLKIKRLKAKRIAKSAKSIAVNLSLRAKLKFQLACKTIARAIAETISFGFLNQVIAKIKAVMKCMNVALTILLTKISAKSAPATAFQRNKPLSTTTNPSAINTAFQTKELSDVFFTKSRGKNFSTSSAVAHNKTVIKPISPLNPLNINFSIGITMATATAPAKNIKKFVEKEFFIFKPLFNY